MIGTTLYDTMGTTVANLGLSDVTTKVLSKRD
jgi:hypothetical protein